MKRTLLWAALLVVTGSAHAQVADTTAPARYFPIGLGDTWEYVRTGAVPGLSWLERRAIVGDTLVDGLPYVQYRVERFANEAPHEPLDEGFTWLLRYDPATAALTTTEPPLPALTGCPLDTPFGAELMCPDDCFTSTFGGLEEAEIGGETVATSVKYFDSQACEITGAYAAGVGFLGYDTFGGSLRLGYANVDGVAVGTPVLPPVEDGQAYFPLEVGAVWEYVGSGILTGTNQRRTIVGDTLIGGTSYVRYRIEDFDAATGAPTAAQTFPLRYDALTASLDAPDGLPFGLTACPLSATPPDTLACGSCTVTVSGGEQEVFVGSDIVETFLKAYDSQACEVLSQYAEGLGFLGYRVRAAGYDLAYVRVGDVELGTPVVVPVGTAPPPAPAAQLRLSAAPNPSSGAVTVWLSLPTSQRVRVDVLDTRGRRVAVLHDGTLNGGLHPLTLDAGLPAGVYVVRALGDGTQATHRVTLVR